MVDIYSLRDHILQGRYYSQFAALDFRKEQEAHVPSPVIDSLMRLQLPLTEDADKYMDEYINLLSDEKWRRELYLKSYLLLIQKIKEIMEMLKDEYDLE